MNTLAHAFIFLLPTNVCKHIHSGLETNFLDYDNEDISIKITVKSEHSENGNCNAADEVNIHALQTLMVFKV